MNRLRALTLRREALALLVEADRVAVFEAAHELDHRLVRARPWLVAAAGAALLLPMLRRPRGVLRWVARAATLYPWVRGAFSRSP